MEKKLLNRLKTGFLYSKLNFLYRTVFVLLLLEILIWSFLTDYSNVTLNLKVGMICSITLVVLILTSTLKALKEFKNFNKINKYFFLIVFFGWSVLALAVYPGFFGDDLKNLLTNTLQGSLSNWFSIAFSFLAIIVEPLAPDHFGFTILSVFLMLSIYIRLLKLRSLTGISELTFFMVLGFLPFVQQFTFFIYRDVYLSFFTTLMIIGFIEIYYLNKPERFRFFEIFCYLFFCSMLRDEAKIYSIFVGAILLIFFFREKKKWLFLYGMTVFSILAITVTWETKELNATYRYKVTGISSSLHYILNYSEKPLDPKIEENLNKVVSVNFLRTGVFDETDAFDKYGFRNPANVEEWHMFLESYFQLVAENLDLFWKNRFYVAGKALYLTGTSYIFQDELESFNSTNRLSVFEKLQARPIFKPLRDVYVEFLNHIQWYTDDKIALRIIFESPIIYIFIFFILLVAAKKKYFLSALFLTICSRNVLVFLTAPEWHLKYYGTFIFPIFTLIYVCYFDAKVAKKD